MVDIPGGGGSSGPGGAGGSRSTASLQRLKNYSRLIPTVYALDRTVLDNQIALHNLSHETH
jgi:hypothetical protein